MFKYCFASGLNLSKTINMLKLSLWLLIVCVRWSLIMTRVWQLVLVVEVRIK